MELRTAFVLTLVLGSPLVACTAAEEALPDTGDSGPRVDSGINSGIDSGIDSGVPSDAGAGVDAETSDGGSALDAAEGADAGAGWDDVDRLAREAVAREGVSGVGLAVYDRDDQLVFQRMYGDFAPDRRVAVASSSKWISGLVLFELVARGQLSLDDTTAEVLGWPGTNGAITLRHLLSFTSGLERDAGCTSRVRVTLAECVDEIRDAPVSAEPGVQFDYGSTHLAVAARMAEVVTGMTWNELFRELIADPLGLPNEVEYYTLPRQSLGRTNPLVAGGLRTSMDEYSKLLALEFHDGVFGGLELGTPELFEAQAREPFPGVVIANSPFQSVGLPYRYGLTAWLECDTPATGCAVLSSPGAFGWTPWVDREHGYYAILGMEGAGTSDVGVVAFSVTLAQALRPAIVEALAE